MTDSMSEVVERLAHIACPAVVQDGPCSGCSMKERGPHGGVRGCILDATCHVKRLLSELSAMGLVVVPREPTEAMVRAMTTLAPTWDDETSRRKWAAAIRARAAMEAA